MFESETQIVTGVERFVGSQIVENGRMIALEFKHPSSRILRLLVPTEIGLELGTHLMVVTAEAKLVQESRPAS